MTKIDWKATLDGWGRSLKKNAPDILIGFGVADLLLGTILAVRATPEAVRRIEEKKKQTKHKKLTTKETIQAAGTCYIPTAITDVIGVGCIIGGAYKKNQRLAALGTAYSLAESTLKDYRDKVIETVGKKKEEMIQSEAVRERIERDYTPGEADDIPEGKGNTLFFDVASGRKFRSDLETLRHAANKLSYQMNNGTCPYISLNEWYMEIGLATIDLGEEVGWNVKKGIIAIETIPTRMSDGTYITGVSFENPPMYDFTAY